MNGLDIAIVVGSVFAFVGGYRRGLVARIVLWASVAGTMLLAADNMSALLRFVHRGEGDPSAHQIVLVVVASLFLGRLVGALVGHWVRRRIPTRPLRVADRLAGGTVGVLGVAITVWLATPILAFLPGWPSGAVRSSTLATNLSRRVPFRLDALAAVRNLVGNSGYPIAISEIGRSFDAGSPPLTTVVTDSIRTQVQSSVVRVTSFGCGVESIGSGFVVRPDQVLTAAHVLAGGRAISVELGTKIVPATIVAFDPGADLALLQLSRGELRNSLRVASNDSIANDSESKGATLDTDFENQAEVLGFVDGGPLKARSVRSSTALSEVGRDIFDERRVNRKVLLLAADLGPGDSGAPVIDRNGTVVGLVFSRAPDRKTTAFALAASELRRFLADADTDVSAATRCPPM